MCGNQKLFERRSPGGRAPVPLRLGIVPAMLAALAGCANVAPEDGFADVREGVSGRTGADVAWPRTAAERAAVHERVEAILAGERLSIDDAVQLAMLNDAALQAQFEVLGIAQSDVVQAGLLKNPVLGAGVRFSDVDDTVPNIDLNIVQNLTDLITRGSRLRIADAEYERVKLDISAQVLRRVADVQSAYYELLGARQIADMRAAVEEAAAASRALAQRYYAAGNINDLDLARETSAAELAVVARMRADAAAASAAARLHRLMGLADRPLQWKIAGRLPALPESEPAVSDLERRALDERLDLAAARERARASAQLLGLSQRWRYLGNVEAGVDAERESDEERLIGPNVSLELPLFDRHQAQIARHGSLMRQAQAEVKALEQGVRGDVRESLQRVQSQREVASRYLQQVIPAHERIVEIGQRYQNYMLIGVFELLAARQAEYDVYQGYLESVRDYWLARVGLQQAVGGRPLDGPLPTGVIELPEPQAGGPASSGGDESVPSMAGPGYDASSASGRAGHDGHGDSGSGMDAAAEAKTGEVEPVQNDPSHHEPHDASSGEAIP
jgi:cobalt-zinc-cadmium efflux system outer membrane protein